MISSYGILEGIGIFADFANTCTALQENLPAMLFLKAFPENLPLSSYYTTNQCSVKKMTSSLLQDISESGKC
jgi:hypothetical protein